MPRSSSIARLLAWAFLASILFAVARIPHAVFQKRIADVREWRRLGEAGWHFRFMDQDNAMQVARIRAQTPKNAIVLYAGETKGALELVSPLIFPRLLVPAAAVSEGAKRFLGRPIASVDEHAIVLVGKGGRIRRIRR